MPNNLSQASAYFALLVSRRVGNTILLGSEKGTRNFSDDLLLLLGSRRSTSLFIELRVLGQLVHQLFPPGIMMERFATLVFDEALVAAELERVGQ